MPSARPSVKVWPVDGGRRAASIWLLVGLAACEASPSQSGQGDLDGGAGVDLGGGMDATSGLDVAFDAGALDVEWPDRGPLDAAEVGADGGRDGGDDAGEDAGAFDAGEDVGAFDADAGADADLGPDGGVDLGVDAGPQPIPVEGFAAGTVGGWQAGADHYLVTSLADDGPGSLREGLRTGGAPRVITFDLDGRVELLSALELPSNVSIDGRGRDVGVRGKGFRMPTGSQVVLHNLVIEDVGPDSEDGLQLGSPLGPAPHHIAVDHLWFLQHGDGGDSANVDEAISVVFGAHAITVAWCRFTAWEKVMLFGNGDADATVDGAITVTVHHNWFESTGRRHPRARYGQFDVVNNFLDRWHAYDWTWLPPYRDSYGSWSQNDAQMIVENNVYERIPVPEDLLTKANDASRCSDGGRIRESGAYLRPGNTAPLTWSEGCDPNGVVFQRPYPLTVDVAEEALVQRLLTEAGNTR